MPTEDGRPKVFISYCWDHPETVERVHAFADFLDANAVHLEMDRYLDAGANLYTFMESMVEDPSVDKVFCFVDRAYTRKAAEGRGGVGTETTILTPEVYRQAARGAQAKVKFVAIVLEKPLDPEHTVPTMFSTAKHVYMTDLTKDALHMTRLLDLAFGKPEFQRSQHAVVPPHLRTGAVGFDQTASGLAVLARTQAKQGRERLALASFEDYLDTVNDVFERLTLNDVPETYYGDRLGTLERMFHARLNLLGEYAAVFDDLLRYTDATLLAPTHGFFDRLMNLCFGYIDRPVKDLARLFARELFVVTVIVYLRRRRYAHLHAFLDRRYRIRDRSWRSFSYFAYGPEDNSQATDWQRAMSRAAWAAAGVSVNEAGQAELILLVWGAAPGRTEAGWSFTNANIWEHDGFRPPLFWNVDSIPSMQPLIEVFQLGTPADLVTQLRAAAEGLGSPQRRVSLAFVLNLAGLVDSVPP